MSLLLLLVVFASLAKELVCNAEECLGVLQVPDTCMPGAGGNEELDGQKARVDIVPCKDLARVTFRVGNQCERSWSKDPTMSDGEQ